LFLPQFLVPKTAPHLPDNCPGIFPYVLFAFEEEPVIVKLAWSNFRQSGYVFFEKNALKY